MIGVRFVSAYLIHILAEFTPDGLQILLIDIPDDRYNQTLVGVHGDADVDIGQALNGLSIKARVHIREAPQGDGAGFGQQLVIAGRKTPLNLILFFEFFAQDHQFGSVRFHQQCDARGGLCAEAHALGNDLAHSCQRNAFANRHGWQSCRRRSLRRCFFSGSGGNGSRHVLACDFTPLPAALNAT